MRYSFLYSIFFSVFLLLGFQKVSAQIPSSATIVNVLSKADEVEITLNADEPFYVGANVFVLHIGKLIYDRYRQTDVDGKGTLVFLIPKNEFETFTKGQDIYLTYGEFWTDDAVENEIHDACKTSPNWAKYLGKLSAEMLSK